MISANDLKQISARSNQPNPSVIEKDYAISWALYAIYSNPKLSEYLVFKGGTCLSKVYIENYRLSEDLDFSAYKTGILSTAELIEELKAALNAANAKGAPALALAEDEVHERPEYVQMRIKYQGPLGQGRIKIDLTRNEQVIYASNKPLSQSSRYADIPKFSIHCYDFFEILIEKMRAILERCYTRDYYDVWQMTSRKDIQKKLIGDANDKHDMSRLRRSVEEKCSRKGVEYAPEMMFDEERVSEAKAHWEESLGRLISSLPPFAQVMKDLKSFFWPEDELAAFQKDGNGERLRNIARDDGAKLILERALHLIDYKMKSKKISDVRAGLDSFADLWENNPSNITLHQEMRAISQETVENLANDKDREIQKKAGAVKGMLHG